MGAVPPQGIIFEGRKERKGRLSPQKAAFARPAKDAGLAEQAGTDLSLAVELVRPDSLIGAAAKGGAFSKSVVEALTEVKSTPSALHCFACLARQMPGSDIACAMHAALAGSRFGIQRAGPSCMQGVSQRCGQDARPAIFALSNPVEEAECAAQQAYDWSRGRAVYVSGTAFPGVERGDGTTFTPGQCNNCLIFPGMYGCEPHYKCLKCNGKVALGWLGHVT